MQTKQSFFGTSSGPFARHCRESANKVEYLRIVPKGRDMPISYSLSAEEVVDSSTVNTAAVIGLTFDAAS